jgi:branched-chain amino acid transport system ATP-binding protein
MPILETKNLTKEFGGVRAVDGLSVAVEKGTVVGIVGPNGSGKTTLIHMLSGMLPFSEGAVMVGGVELSMVRPFDIAAYGITRTFQNIRLFEQMTVLDNVLLTRTERNVFSALFERHSEYHAEEAKRALTGTGLWEKRNQLAVNLSYGQRKLLEIARALAMKADIYLFDEPFAGLFPEMAAIVERVIMRLREEEKTIVLIEHNMEIIRELCSRVIVMGAGRLLADGKPEEVLKQKDVVEAYLGE